MNRAKAIIRTRNESGLNLLIFFSSGAVAQGFAKRLVALRQRDLPAAVRDLPHRAERIGQEVFRAARAALR